MGWLRHWSRRILGSVCELSSGLPSRGVTVRQSSEEVVIFPERDLPIEHGSTLLASALRYGPRFPISALSDDGKRSMLSLIRHALRLMRSARTRGLSLRRHCEQTASRSRKSIARALGTVLRRHAETDRQVRALDWALAGDGDPICVAMAAAGDCHNRFLEQCAPSLVWWLPDEPPRRSFLDAVVEQGAFLVAAFGDDAPDPDVRVISDGNRTLVHVGSAELRTELPSTAALVQVLRRSPGGEAWLPVHLPQGYQGLSHDLRFPDVVALARRGVFSPVYASVESHDLVVPRCWLRLPVSDAGVVATSVAVRPRSRRLERDKTLTEPFIQE